MSYESEVRLRDVENQLSDLIERQRIGRFDTVVFLAYPAILSGLAALANDALQFENLRRIQVLGQPVIDLILVMAIIFAVGIVRSFGHFIPAFLRDDLRGRISSCLSIVNWSVFLLYFSSSSLLILPFGELGKRSFGYDWIGFLVWAIFSEAFRDVRQGLIIASAQASVSWFEKNTPRRLDLERRIGTLSGPGAEWRDPLMLRKYTLPPSESASFHFMLSKISALIGCVVYGVLLLRAFAIEGISDTLYFHGFALTALIIMIVVLSLGSIKTALRRTPKYLKSLFDP